MINSFIYLRKIISGYEDVVKAGVRVKNQRAALLRSNFSATDELKRVEDIFVLDGLDRSIASYEKEKMRYEKEFKRLSKSHKVIQHLRGVPGIGIINSVKHSSSCCGPSSI